MVFIHSHLIQPDVGEWGEGRQMPGVQSWSILSRQEADRAPKGPTGSQKAWFLVQSFLSASSRARPCAGCCRHKVRQAHFLLSKDSKFDVRDEYIRS